MQSALLRYLPFISTIILSMKIMSMEGMVLLYSLITKIYSLVKNQVSISIIFIEKVMIILLILWRSF